MIKPGFASILPPTYLLNPKSILLITYDTIRIGFSLSFWRYIFFSLCNIYFIILLYIEIFYTQKGIMLSVQLSEFSWVEKSIHIDSTQIKEEIILSFMSSFSVPFLRLVDILKITTVFTSFHFWHNVLLCSSRRPQTWNPVSASKVLGL
jgi:hypothetical protein